MCLCTPLNIMLTMALLVSSVKVAFSLSIHILKNKSIWNLYKTVEISISAENISTASTADSIVTTVLFSSRC